MKKTKTKATHVEDLENDEEENLVPNDDVPTALVPKSTSDETSAYLDWPELESLSIEDMVAEGWIPRIKTKRGGSRFITLRRIIRDEDGKRHDEERGLGAYADDRWAKLLSYYPKVEVPSKTVKRQAKGSTVLSTGIAKPKPLTSSIHLDISTLQWYMWAQQKAGYPGTFEEFINQCVNAYFTEHHKLELAVISPSD
jgi:hypothetical protein